MIVYIITGGYEHEDTYILGVASSEEKAKEICTKETTGLDWVEIIGWEVEE